MLLLFLLSIAQFYEANETNITDTYSPEPTESPLTNDPPKPYIVWITCIGGTAFIGCVVLYLCVKKQPDDSLFDNPRDHLNSIASLNSLQAGNDNISAPLIFTPEGSLN